MSYADSLLAKGEHIVYRGRQHWLAPVSDSLRPVVLVLAGLVVFFLATVLKWTGLAWQMLAGLGAILVLIGLVWTAIVFLTWRAQEYLITNRRVLKVEGLLDKKSGDSSLDKINDAVLSQGLLARLLKYGSLDILTANEEAIDRYQMLNHAVDFKKAMLDAKNDLEDGYRGARSGAGPAAEAPAAPSARSSSSDDVTATLAKLADLRDKGAITAAEYETKKAELLGRL
jgi:uncharacterized membrane protein YdbT with pleckstrin-like domain